MENSKIKVAMVTNHFGVTGISTVILNYCKALNKEKYSLTVIAGNPIAKENRKQCIENGINLVELPSRREQTIKHYYGLLKVLKKNKYDIVHVHGSSSMMAIELTIAMMAGTKIRIAHSHNSMCQNMLMHKVLNSYFRKIYTKALACGKLAGDWLFGEGQFEILPNGFHIEQFVFSATQRHEIRNELNVDDKFIMGHIGRINAQKNQEYLLKVFEQVAYKCKDAVLLLVGTGPDEEKLQQQIQKHPYKDRIVMYGETDNPAAIYSAIDVFVFPSKFEGLPVVLLEAQISGLPCVVSDKVTKEVDLDNIEWMSIEDSPEKWAKSILNIKKYKDSERINFAKTYITQIKKYDIRQSVKQLNNIYLKLIKEVD